MSKRNKHRMELIFSQSSSDSKREKVRKFWKFLDAHSELQPYVPVEGEKTPVSDLITREAASSSRTTEERGIWQAGLRLFQELGLERTAFASNAPCNCDYFEKIDREKLKYADSIVPTCDELNEEMKVFDKRLSSEIDNIEKQQ